MLNHSIIFLFLVCRDIIVANKATKPSFPSICNAMTFDMQCRHVIDIPRDLFLLEPQKKYNRSVSFFFFFSSTTFSDGLPLIHGLPFRNSKKYDMSLCLSHMMVDRSSLCYFWGSDFLFCKEKIFVTKYRIQSHVICRFLLYMLLFWKKTKM